MSFTVVVRAAVMASVLVPCTGLLQAQDPPGKSAPKTVPARAMRIVPAKPQGPVTQSELMKRRAKKLSKEVFSNADWHYDYDEAKAAAAAQGKLVLTYFTRSYSP